MTRRYLLAVTAPARQDIIDIESYTVKNFGIVAAGRYSALIRQAFHDLRTDPVRPSVRMRDDIGPDLRVYHLSYSRVRAASRSVKSPRHFLVFRVRDDVIEIVRILHDSRDLARHLPASEEL